MRRVRSVLLALAVVPAINAAAAQSILVGGRFGGTSAIFRSHDFQHYERVNGMSWGFTGALQLLPWFALGTDVLYAQKGARSGQSFEMRLDYLDVPVHLRLSTPDVHGLRAFFGAGVVYSREVGCSGRTPFAAPDVLSSSVAPFGALDCNSQRKKRSDQAHALGGGISYSAGRREFTLEVRRARSLYDISESSYPGFRNDVTTICLGAAHKLNFGWTQ